ncbi:MAG: oligosaccharide flippase family protein [Alphaproteobacteria bacterium]|nr:oligosaccharide flippase family protein [Alphaproteobacteria bacterium]
MMGVDVAKSLRLPGIGARSGAFLAGRRGAMAKNVAVLGFGAALSQILTILSTPVLGWYYTPGSFGIMATSLSIVYIVSCLSNANYETAIILTEQNQAIDLLSLCLILNLFSSIIFCLISVLAFNLFDILPDYPSWMFITLMSIGIFLTSTFSTLQYYAVRIEDYPASSASHVMRTLFALVIQMAGVLFHSNPVWLIAGRVFGPLPGIGYLLRRDGESLWNHRLTWRVADLMTVARHYRRFPLYAAPQRIIALLAEEMPTLVLASVFGPSPAGYYWFSSRLSQVPCGVISQAIGRVFSREAAKTIYQGRTTFRPAIKIVTVLAIVAIPAVAVVILWAPELFDILLGPEWQTAAVYCQWIVVWVFFRFSVSPILCLFTILNEQKRLLKLDSVVFVIRAVVIACCAIAFDALTLVMVFSVFESAKIVLYAVIILRLARRPVAPAGPLTSELRAIVPLP